MRITLYGKLGEAIGREVSLNDARCRTVLDVRQALAELYPRSAADLLSPRVRACIGDVMVGNDHAVAPGEELALLPPVSGG